MAVSFTTGPAPAVLTSITARAANSDPTGTTFDMRLWSSIDGHPGAVIEDYPTQFSNAPEPLLTFVSSGVPLAAGTTYWVEFVRAAPPFAYWGDTLLPGEVSAYGWTIGDVSLATTAPWGPLLLGASPPIGRIAIDAVIVPEPSVVAPAVLASALVFGRLRRKA